MPSAANTINMRYQALLRYFLFWGLVFLINTGPHWEKYVTLRELIETVGLITGLQYLVAAISIKWLVPNFLDKGNKKTFFCVLFIMLFMVSELNVVIRDIYLEPRYPVTYESYINKFGHMNLVERMAWWWTIKYIFFYKIPVFLFPCAILIAHNFYRKQEKLLKLSEQKNAAELTALKNQLNPHFIFNTLNNIYALALKKSDQTPVAIEKLSGILDYVLYRCNDKFVLLSDEVELIESHIALEKIRYGKRLLITFENHVDGDAKIAPLVLLTLLENACKHSTSQELNQATVNITLKTVDDTIIFDIENSKPHQLEYLQEKQGGIGLENMKKQLELLYPDTHQLIIEDSKDRYRTELRLNYK